MRDFLPTLTEHDAVMVASDPTAALSLPRSDAAVMRVSNCPLVVRAFAEMRVETLPALAETSQVAPGAVARRTVGWLPAADPKSRTVLDEV